MAPTFVTSGPASSSQQHGSGSSAKHVTLCSHWQDTLVFSDYSYVHVGRYSCTPSRAQVTVSAEGREEGRQACTQRGEEARGERGKAPAPSQGREACTQAGSQTPAQARYQEGTQPGWL